MEITGRYATAVCYADIIEYDAQAQIRRMCDYPFTEGSKIRIMPDVHAGVGCTIGTTMTVTDKAVPNVVGVDIGCGMYSVNIGRDDIDFAVFDEAAHYVPSRFDVWEGRPERFDLTRLKCYSGLDSIGKIERSLGTLGGGNHFIEIDRSEDGTHWLIIHTGSRNLGKQVAGYYQKLAVDLDRGKGEYLKKRDDLIAGYKAKGKRREIQGALQAMTPPSNAGTMPEDLCYLTGEYLADYIHDVKICQEFARRNREKIAEVLLSRTGLTAYDSFHTVHNYIDTDRMILRKGAISAQLGERVLIPINMRDGSILAVGRGNPEWNYSAPHGAGRLMSRSTAKESLSMDDYREAMSGVYTTSVSEFTLDESPMAYKPLEAIIDVIAGTVDIVSVMKPVYNFKAS
ncbi:MAG: RtcB family protein [Synergistaceae bacterium]|nr:RtcB family protein [Synergistaceae bacterium]MBQ6972262.1 RtcB family protein [Synergistaceae bacterium]